MRDLRRLAILLALVALALPCAALAQSAGDNQYQDPFGGQQGSGNSNSGNSGSSGGSNSSGSGGSRSGSRSGSSNPAPLTQAPPATGARSGSSAAAAPATSQGRLPKTGFEAALYALLGLGLVLTGVGLRLRISELG